MTPPRSHRCRVFAVCLAALALGGTVGCGGGKGTVSGKVSYNGQPVTDGRVSFLGPDGIPVEARIEPNGEYRAVDVPLGEAKVLVTSPPAGGLAPKKKEPRPPRGQPPARPTPPPTPPAQKAPKS